MAGGEHVGHHLHLHRHLVHLSRPQRFGIEMRLPVRGVQTAVTDQLGGSVRRHVDQLHPEIGDLGRGGDVQHGPGRTRYLQRFVKWSRGVGQGVGLVGPLVDGIAPRENPTPPMNSRRDPHGGFVLETVSFLIRALGGRPAQLPVRVKVHPGGLLPGNGPFPFGAPETRLLDGHDGRGWIVLPHEDRHRRLVEDPVVDPLEPIVEPLQHDGPAVDSRPGHRFLVLGPDVSPGPHQRFLVFDFQLGEGSQQGRRIDVRPAGNDEDRALDPAVVRRQGAVLPVRPFLLMRDVSDSPGLAVLQPRLPDVAPLLTDDLGIGGSEVVSRHERGKGVEHVGAKRAAGIGPLGIDAVVGRAHDDGLEAGRILDGHLPLHHPPVGNAGHAHVAVRPGLTRDPFDHLVAVPPLVIGVDVLAPATGVSRAPDVVLDDGIAPFRQIRNQHGPFITIVRLGFRNPAVGVVHHDGGKPALRVRHRDLGRQLHPVAHGDAGVDDLDLPLVNRFRKPIGLCQQGRGQDRDQEQQDPHDDSPSQSGRFRPGRYRTSPEPAGP